MTASDIARKYDMHRSSVSDRLQKLAEEGYIELSQRKTDDMTNYLFQRCKVYKPTREGLEYGGLGSMLGKLTAGPESWEVKDLHGKLTITYEIKDRPLQDPVEWDKINKLNNGVEQKIKKIGPSEGSGGTIEMTGRDDPTLTLKPRLKGTKTDDLKERLNALVWSVYQRFTNKGYHLGIPEQKGEAKWSLVSDELPEPGEYENFTIDESDGRECHPKTGDFETNAEMAKMISEKGHMAKTSKKIDRLEQKVDQQAETIERMADVMNKLTDRLSGLGEQLEQPEGPDPGSAPGGMYG